MRRWLASLHEKAPALWSGLDAIAVPAASLLLTGGLLRTIGPEDYGLMVIVLALSQLSTAINPAIAASTTHAIAGARTGEASSPDNTLARIAMASVAVMAVIGTLILLLATLLVSVLREAVLGSELARRPDSGVVLLLGVAAVCIQQMDAVLSAVLRGLERFRPQAIYEVISRFLTSAAAVSAGAVTKELTVVMATLCCAYGVSALGRSVLLRTQMPHRTLFARPSLTQVVSLLRFGGWMWLNATATAAYGTVDRILVGRWLGAAAAAEFQLYIQLTQLIHFLPSSLFGYAFPLFSRLNATLPSAGKGAALRATLFGVLRKSVLCGVVGAVLLLLASDALIRVFASASLDQPSYVTFLLLMGSFLMLTPNIAPYFMLLGLGRARTVSLLTSASVLAAIALAVLLIPTIGLAGAGLARFAYALGTLLLIPIALRAVARA